jgi:hypothetical protein
MLVTKQGLVCHLADISAGFHIGPEIQVFVDTFNRALMQVYQC